MHFNIQTIYIHVHITAVLISLDIHIHPNLPNESCGNLHAGAKNEPDHFVFTLMSLNEALDLKHIKKSTEINSITTKVREITIFF